MSGRRRPHRSASRRTRGTVRRSTIGEGGAPGLRRAILYPRAMTASPVYAPAWTYFAAPGVIRRTRRAGRTGDRSGTVLGGQWELRGRLGGGGMGEVYWAASCLDRRPYAVKILRAKHGRGSRVRRRLPPRSRRLPPTFRCRRTISSRWHETRQLHQRALGEILCERTGERISRP